MSREKSRLMAFGKLEKPLGKIHARMWRKKRKNVISVICYLLALCNMSCSIEVYRPWRLRILGFAQVVGCHTVTVIFAEEKDRKGGSTHGYDMKNMVKICDCFCTCRVHCKGAECRVHCNSGKICHDLWLRIFKNVVNYLKFSSRF